MDGGARVDRFTKKSMDDGHGRGFCSCRRDGLPGSSAATQLALQASYKAEEGQTPLHHLKLDPVSGRDGPVGSTGVVLDGRRGI